MKAKARTRPRQSNGTTRKCADCKCMLSCHNPTRYCSSCTPRHKRLSKKTIKLLIRFAAEGYLQK